MDGRGRSRQVVWSMTCCRFGRSIVLLSIQYFWAAAGIWEIDYNPCATWAVPLYSDSFLCNTDTVNLKKFLFWTLVSSHSPVQEKQAYPPQKLQAGTQDLSYKPNTHRKRRNSKTQNCCCAFVFNQGLHGEYRRDSGGAHWEGFERRFEMLRAMPNVIWSGRTSNECFCWDFTTQTITQMLKAPKQNPATQNTAILMRVWTFLMTEHSLIMVWRLIKLYTKITVGIIWCLVEETGTNSNPSVTQDMNYLTVAHAPSYAF